MSVNEFYHSLAQQPSPDFTQHQFYGLCQTVPQYGNQAQMVGLGVGALPGGTLPPAQAMASNQMAPVKSENCVVGSGAITSPSPSAAPLGSPGAQPHQNQQFYEQLQ